MPMIPEGAIAMLACSRIGAIHSVVFGGFAAKELANRIDHCEPKLVITASAGIEPHRILHYPEIVDQALSMCTKVDKHLPRLMKQRTEADGRYAFDKTDHDCYFDYDSLMA